MVLIMMLKGYILLYSPHSIWAMVIGLRFCR